MAAIRGRSVGLSQLLVSGDDVVQSCVVAPLCYKIFGERLLFIRYQGKCYAVENRCAHRACRCPSAHASSLGPTRSVAVIMAGHTMSPMGMCVAALTRWAGFADCRKSENKKLSVGGA